MMKIVSILLIFIFFSCNNLTEKRKSVLWKMSQSNNVDSIIDATIEIQKAEDTSMLGALLYNANDPRISHKPFQKGMSVYQIKMNALRQITKIEPPCKITYSVDTSIIRFYRQLLKGEK